MSTYVWTGMNARGLTAGKQRSSTNCMNRSQYSGAAIEEILRSTCGEERREDITKHRDNQTEKARISIQTRTESNGTHLHRR